MSFAFHQSTEATVPTNPLILRSFSWLCLFLLAAPGTSYAQLGILSERLSIHVNGGIQSGSTEFDIQQPFTVYGEAGQVATDHNIGGGGLFDAGGYVQVWEELRIGATFTYVSTSEEATLTGSVPHPFLTGINRQFGPETIGFDQSERTTHIQAAWVFPMPNYPQLDITLFGGPSFFHVSRSTLSGVTLSETAPPFTSVTAGARTEDFSGNGWGGNVGADVTYNIANGFGVGGFIRFSKGSITLPLLTQEVSLSVGGLQTGGGLRLSF